MKPYSRRMQSQIMSTYETRLSQASAAFNTKVRAGQWRRSLLSEIIRVAAFPVYDRRQGLAFSRYLRQFRSLEFAPPEIVEQIQWKRLNLILRHAAANVPYYRDLFYKEGIAIDEIRTAADFSGIPVLGKTELQQHHAALLTDHSNTFKP